MPREKTGSERIDNMYSTLIMAGIAVVAGLAIAKMGMVIGVAFIAILVAGLAGGLIGFSLIDLQCHGSCDLQNSVGLIFGSVVSASGMGIVAVLVLRAVGEWSELEDRK